MPLIPAHLEPNLLAWVQISVNIEPVDAPCKTCALTDRVVEWGECRGRRTVGQLREAAMPYRRPFAACYLTEPLHGAKGLRNRHWLHPMESVACSAATYAQYGNVAYYQRQALLRRAELDRKVAATRWCRKGHPHPDEQLADSAGLS